MKYLLIYRSIEGDYLISSSDNKEEIMILYFYYTYRKVKNLKILKTINVKLQKI